MESGYPRHVLVLAGKASQALTRALARPKDAPRFRQEFRRIIFELHGHGLPLRAIAGLTGISTAEIGRALVLEEARPEPAGQIQHPTMDRAE